MEVLNTKDRYYYLDWIKILATAGVFLLHVAHIFDTIPFQIQNNETSLIYLLIVIYLNFWIMPLFFFLSGVSTFISLKKRDNKSFLIERVVRLLIPFATGLFLLALPQDYVEALNYGLFSGSFLEFVPYHLKNVFDLVKNTNILCTTALFAEFAHHVWFLAFLFFYSLIALPFFRFFQAKEIIFFKSSITDKKLLQIVFSFMIPLCLILYLLKPLDPTYTSWPDFFYWGTFYFMGYILFSKQEIIDVIENRKFLFLVIGAISFFSITIYLSIIAPSFYTSPDYSLISILGHFLWTITTISWIFFIIGSGKKWLNFKNQYLTHFSSGAMPFYLIHLPVILLIAYFVVQLNLNLNIKFVIIFILSLLASIFLIQVIIINVNSISFLFGIKQKKLYDKER